MELTMKSLQMGQMALRKWHRDFYVRVSHFDSGLENEYGRVKLLYNLYSYHSKMCWSIHRRESPIDKETPGHHNGLSPIFFFIYLFNIITEKYESSSVGSFRRLSGIKLGHGFGFFSFRTYFFDNQVGKLKILCESFFKLKSVKLKLFLQEEVCFRSRNLFKLIITILSEFYRVALSRSIYICKPNILNHVK